MFIKRWLALLLLVLLAPSLWADENCRLGDCRYTVSLDKRGTYIATVTLPSGQPEGVWSLTLNPSRIFPRYLNGFWAGSVLKEQQELPNWAGFSLSQRESIDVTPYQWIGDGSPLTVQIHQDKGRRALQSVYGPTLMNPGQTYTTPPLNPGFYIADFLSQLDSPRTYQGLALEGNSLYGGVVGGYLDSFTGVGYGAFLIDSPTVVDFLLLFGETFGELGSAQPYLEVYYQHEEGTRELYWTTSNQVNDLTSTVVEGILVVGDTQTGNAKIDFYLGKEQSPIIGTSTDSNGYFTAKMLPPVSNQLEKGTSLQMSANVEGKILRALVLNYSPQEGGYVGNDMVISYYSEAVFQIAEALSLDIHATADLYRSFLKAYQGGTFNFKHRRAQGFAFHAILQEVADNIQAHYVSNAPLFSQEQIIEKIGNLNHVNPQDFIAKYYALPLVYEKGDKTILQVVSFQTSGLLDKAPFQISAEFFHNTDSPFYDEATAYLFHISPEAVLNDVKITTYDPQPDGTLIDEEYFTTLTDGEQHSVIKNNNFELLLEEPQTPRTRKQPSIVSGIFYDDEKLIAKLNFNQKVPGNVSLRVRYFLEDEGPLYFDKKIHESERSFKDGDDMVVQDDLTDKFSVIKDKHIVVLIKVELKEEKDIFFGVEEYAYDFVDWKKDYANATVEQFTLSETRFGKYVDDEGCVNSRCDNEFLNKKGHEEKHVGKVPTHRLLDFDKIVDKDINYHSEDKVFYWKNSKYAKEVKANFASGDTRTPLLLIHGWQGDYGQENPAALLHPQNTELEYWRNFVNYYMSQEELYNNYRLYFYHYPSYKHVSFNARMLALLLEQVKNKANEPLGQALNGEGIVIVAHSMGGLVARSLIEEYHALGEDAEKLLRLITLDTPHHGSPSAIELDLRPEAGGSLAKNLETPGAASLYWDNYDEKYPVTSSKRYQLRTNWEEIEDEREKALGKKHTLFDDYYYKKLTNQKKLYKVNPFLAFLNEKFEDKADRYAREKYIFYVAHLSPGYSIGDNKLDPIKDTFGMHENKRYINDVGYASGGAEPVCSAFLSNETKIDNETRFTPMYMDIEAYVDINDEGYEGNYNIPFRWFWDYDHEMMVNGAYDKKGEWDAFIDKKKKHKCSEYTAFMNLNYLQDFCENMRGAYILSVRMGFNGQKLLFEDAKSHSSDDTHLHLLRNEPVFLAIKKDLLRSLPQKVKIVGSIKVVGSIKDAVNNEPLSGVKLTIHETVFLIPVVVTEVTTKEDGSYIIENLVSDKTYQVSILKSGYIPEMMTIQTSSDPEYYLETVLQVSEDYAGIGDFGGKITHALTGKGVSGLSIAFRQGINVKEGSVVETVTTDSEGDYLVSGLEAGNYTGEITGEGYNTVYFTAMNIGGETTNDQKASVTPILSEGETRVILTWGASPKDLDSHMTGPNPESDDRFHVYFFSKKGSQDTSPYTFLDLDDRDSYGPETTTIVKQFEGVYRFFVHDFSNKNESSSTALANSKAKVTVYRGSHLVRTFNVPNTEGTLWKVFELNGNNITPLNIMEYESGTSVISTKSRKPDTIRELIRQLPEK